MIAQSQIPGMLWHPTWWVLQNIWEVGLMTFSCRYLKNLEILNFSKSFKTLYHSPIIHAYQHREMIVLSFPSLHFLCRDSNEILGAAKPASSQWTNPPRSWRINPMRMKTYLISMPRWRNSMTNGTMCVNLVYRNKNDLREQWKRWGCKMVVDW